MPQVIFSYGQFLLGFSAILLVIRVDKSFEELLELILILDMVIFVVTGVLFCFETSLNTS